MKTSFPLENSTWPAFMMAADGTIVRANPVAIHLFAPALAADSAPLSSIWSSKNEVTAEKFVSEWQSAVSSIARLKFRTAAGRAIYSTCVCQFSKEDKKFFMFQLLPENTTNGAADKSPDAEAAEVKAPAAEPAAKVPSNDAAMAQKQKLDCALQLARTVALDFNNALTSILGYTSLLLSQIEPNNPWRRALLEVEKSASKAAEIASDLGAFSRQDKEPRGQQAGNLNSILQRSVEVLQNSGGPAKVEWTQQLERKLFAAKFDEAKMQQAFVKILENSLQSINGTGRVSVQSRNLELKDPTQDRDVRLVPGTYICVEITDNGCGIAADVLPRIFEPFFTTKKDGNHRGLGLAWVYGIVTNHGGGVAVSSKPEVGTSVRVYLPAENKIVRDSTVDPGDLKGKETILMVDDEDLLLTMGQTVLSAFGYQVLTANSGQKALEMFAKAKPPVDLVITDLVMPTMSGRELVEHIRKQSPETRILCTSGFVQPNNHEKNGVYLQKPFTSQELLTHVKHALGN